MKRYTWKLAIAFILSYVLLMVVVVFSYTRISENFILNQAKQNLIDQNQIITNRINAQFDFDYQQFNELILYYENLSLNPIDELNANIEMISVNGQNFEGFGTLDQRTLSLLEETFTYLSAFDNEDFEQNIAIYSFAEAFGDANQTVYIFFMVDEYVAYFDAQIYLDSILDLSDMHDHYLIVSADNVVAYRSFLNGSFNYFYDYLRAEGVSESSIDVIKSKLMSGTSGASQHKFLGVNSFIVYSPLNTELSTKNYYLIQTFNENVVITSLGYLTNILWALFFVIFILFAGALVLLFKILEQKVNDIENARLAHYYAKPYIVRVSHKGKIKSYNHSFKKLLGDYDIYDYVTDFDTRQDSDLDLIEDVLKRQRAFTAIFELGFHKLVYVRFIPLKTTGGYILIGDDITSIEGKFDEYRHMALFNKVTHLPNYNSLKQDLQSFFDNVELLEKKNSLLALDIVSFSKINLLLGEKSGDRFLVIVSELIDESLEGYPATLYNIVADSFVVFFKDIENYNWVTRWAQKLITTFEKPITIDKNFINIDVKMGIFNIEVAKYEIMNSEIVYENMQLALNHAKESTQQKYFIYDVSLSMVASREQRMEQDLAYAIKNNEFYMALQPQYDNQKEKITGFEALIRWNNPKYASESPLKFIEMAERNNMIIDIGRIALHETFLIAKELERYDIHISMNISPVQLLQAGFVNEVCTIYEQYDLKKGAVSLEITETFLIGSFELIINKLKLLKKYGFNIHLDDFGTGYSSLQYLKDLPINTLKIDRAFIINLESDAYSRAIVQMISSLAKNVGLEVIAEGIENDRQNQLVYKSGCNIIQGYLISPAVVKSEAIKLIEDYNINKTKKVEVQKKEIKR
ncbi:putative bifunctional diguanylate cyclase/phosphodiesterase [Peloplasma aerotolerans]|uniref:Bifunctional diguanylate cyclase/phosphodiesterase n=1 Tax=Peloplasma aerotolerans TaxID=3044389 RepID=A0AAW6U3J5_9MOLU|nr:bifunctional diguanylate cyclase/phosphodiesterase [Mariniplasma sp. M4Ah]MDI6452452.1 bifunctional diguanylate cyclase/phosphodiesterase [Mariniplasma sp. M4Ah]